MNLYIVRHAIAVPRGTPDYEDDSQRPLTRKGRKKMEKIAQGLKSLEVELDLILTSPYVRAVDTARIVKKELGLGDDQVLETEHLTPGGDHSQMIQWINEQYAAAANIALVGHEPSLSQLISTLVCGDPNLALVLKKGGVCRLSVETLRYGRCAALEWLLSPSQLAELGD
jgi:phosphohistidine phosphatase